MDTVQTPRNERQCHDEIVCTLLVMQHNGQVTRAKQQARQLREGEQVSNKKGYLNHLHLPVIVAIAMEVRQIRWWWITAAILGTKRRIAKWCVAVWFKTHFVAPSAQPLFRLGVHGEEWLKVP